MRGNAMTPDELADALKDWMDQAHAYVETLPAGAFKGRSRRLMAVLHAAANALKDHAVDGGVIQPYSGGDPKPPEGP